MLERSSSGRVQSCVVVIVAMCVVDVLLAWW